MTILNTTATSTSASSPFSFHCRVCYEPFNSSTNPPIILTPCGHTYVCLQCADTLTECPECKRILKPCNNSNSSRSLMSESIMIDSDIDNINEDTFEDVSLFHDKERHEELKYPKNVVLLSLMDMADVVRNVNNIEKNYSVDNSSPIISLSKKNVLNDNNNHEEKSNPILVEETINNSNEYDDGGEILISVMNFTTCCGTYIVNDQNGGLVLPEIPIIDNSNNTIQYPQTEQQQSYDILSNGTKLQIITIHENNYAEIFNIGSSSTIGGYIHTNQIIKIGPPSNKSCMIKSMLNNVVKLNEELLLQRKQNLNFKLDKLNCIKKELELELNNNFNNNNSNRINDNNNVIQVYNNNNHYYQYNQHINHQQQHNYSHRSIRNSMTEGIIQNEEPLTPSPSNNNLLLGCLPSFDCSNDNRTKNTSIIPVRYIMNDENYDIYDDSMIKHTFSDFSATSLPTVMPMMELENNGILSPTTTSIKKLKGPNKNYHHQRSSSLNNLDNIIAKVRPCTSLMESDEYDTEEVVVKEKLIREEKINNNLMKVDFRTGFSSHNGIAHTTIHNNINNTLSSSSMNARLSPPRKKNTVKLSSITYNNTLSTSTSHESDNDMQEFTNNKTTSNNNNDRYQLSFGFKIPSFDYCSSYSFEHDENISILQTNSIDTNIYNNDRYFCTQQQPQPNNKQQQKETSAYEYLNINDEKSTANSSNSSNSNKDYNSDTSIVTIELHDDASTKAAISIGLIFSPSTASTTADNNHNNYHPSNIDFRTGFSNHNGISHTAMHNNNNTLSSSSGTATASTIKNNQIPHHHHTNNTSNNTKQYNNKRLMSTHSGIGLSTIGCDSKKMKQKLLNMLKHMECINCHSHQMMSEGIKEINYYLLEEDDELSIVDDLEDLDDESVSSEIDDSSDSIESGNRNNIDRYSCLPNTITTATNTATDDIQHSISNIDNDDNIITSNKILNDTITSSTSVSIMNNTNDNDDNNQETALKHNKEAVNNNYSAIANNANTTILDNNGINDNNIKTTISATDNNDKINLFLNNLYTKCESFDNCCNDNEFDDVDFTNMLFPSPTPSPTGNKKQVTFNDAINNIYIPYDDTNDKLQDIEEADNDDNHNNLYYEEEKEVILQEQRLQNDQNECSSCYYDKDVLVHIVKKRTKDKNNTIVDFRTGFSTHNGISHNNVVRNNTQQYSRRSSSELKYMSSSNGIVCATPTIDDINATCYPNNATCNTLLILSEWCSNLLQCYGTIDDPATTTTTFDDNTASFCLPSCGNISERKNAFFNFYVQ